MQYDHYVQRRVGSTLPERHDCSPDSSAVGDRRLEGRGVDGMGHDMALTHSHGLHGPADKDETEDDML